MQLGYKEDKITNNRTYYWKSNMKVFAEGYMDMISHRTEKTE